MHWNCQCFSVTTPIHPTAAKKEKNKLITSVTIKWVETFCVILLKGEKKDKSVDVSIVLLLCACVRVCICQSWHVSGASSASSRLLASCH